MKLKNWPLLEMMANYEGVEIDRNKPRESRLKVAFAYDEKGKVPEAIEAMTGIPLNEQDPMYITVLSINRVQSDPQKFYNGFAPIDQ